MDRETRKTGPPGADFSELPAGRGAGRADLDVRRLARPRPVGAAPPGAGGLPVPQLPISGEHSGQRGRGGPGGTHPALAGDGWIMEYNFHKYVYDKLQYLFYFEILH